MRSYGHTPNRGYFPDTVSICINNGQSCASAIKLSIDYANAEHWKKYN